MPFTISNQRLGPVGQYSSKHSRPRDVFHPWRQNGSVAIGASDLPISPGSFTLAVASVDVNNVQNFTLQSASCQKILKLSQQTEIFQQQRFVITNTKSKAEKQIIRLSKGTNGLARVVLNTKTRRERLKSALYLRLKKLRVF